MDNNEEKQLESLGAFEISDRLIALAKEKATQPFLMLAVVIQTGSMLVHD